MNGMPRDDGLCVEHGKRIANAHLRIDDVHKSLRGTNGKFGMLTKIEILWRSQIWLVSLVSAAVGAGIAIVVQRAFAS